MFTSQISKHSKIGIRHFFHVWKYLSVRTVSLMNGNKSSIRSRITDRHLGSVLKLISANKIAPEVEKMVAEKRCQESGEKY